MAENKTLRVDTLRELICTEHKIHYEMTEIAVFHTTAVEFRRNGDGIVFTGVCLFTRGVPHLHPIILPSNDPMSFLGVPHCLIPCPFPGVHQTLAMTGWGTPPPPSQERIGYSPCQDRLGNPPSQDKTGYTPSLETEQHSEYLLRDGWYASSIHARGLSCLGFFF